MIYSEYRGDCVFWVGLTDDEKQQLYDISDEKELCFSAILDMAIAKGLDVFEAELESERS